MERFVRFVVAGGLTLLAGLWVDRLLAWPRAALGVALALAGLCLLGVGIAGELEVEY
ncbi:hypothetical protein J2752_000731 [Halarchaeum rubridurum]|uniref:Uncharacterized protein n=1 Tax=Halarchaeum rubridurum TaxID=489911 RepID=A0A8T4GJY1_9EURY|nr:hypothetical protein [Halarchaeum rubridurum]MBP1953850.1 hypothetical protein [Halarchaeum rubridurum]